MPLDLSSFSRRAKAGFATMRAWRSWPCWGKERVKRGQPCLVRLSRLGTRLERLGTHWDYYVIRLHCRQLSTTIVGCLPFCPVCQAATIGSCLGKSNASCVFLCLVSCPRAASLPRLHGSFPFCRFSLLPLPLSPYFTVTLSLQTRKAPAVS